MSFAAIDLHIYHVKLSYFIEAELNRTLDSKLLSAFFPPSVPYYFFFQMEMRYVHVSKN